MYEHEKRERRAPTPYNPIEHGRGYPAPEPSLVKAMQTYLRARGLCPGLAALNNWYPSRSAGDGYARMVMPATNTAGYPYWQARLLGSELDDFYRDENPYLAPRRYQSPHYSRGDSLIIVWPPARHPQEVQGAVIVEGPLDALAAAGEDYVGVSLMGNAPTEEVLDHLVRLVWPNQRVIVVPDRDDPAWGAKIGPSVASRGVLVTIVAVAPYEDLAAVPTDERRKILEG